MVSEPEWVLRAEEKFWQPEELKVEKDYPLRPQFCGLFFSEYTLRKNLIMNFSESLKKNGQFREVYKKGKSYANKYLVIYVLENNQDKNYLGISVSKKVGNSIVRHRLARLIRESYRLH